MASLIHLNDTIAKICVDLDILDCQEPKLRSKFDNSGTDYWITNMLQGPVNASDVLEA